MDIRIAVIASNLHPIRQKHLLDWYEDLSVQNSNTQLFLGSKNENIPSALNYKVNSKFEKLKFKISGFLQLNSKQDNHYKIQPLINYDPQIIHLLTSNVFPNIGSILQNKNKKLIVSFRGFDINVFPNQSGENKNMTRRIFQRADCLHFVSEDLKKAAIGLGADPKKCTVIYRSIRTNLPQNLNISRSEIRRNIIISVGRLVWEKGYIYALETMAILKLRGYDFEYQIVGKGIDFSMLIFHVNRLNIQDRVNFLGELSGEEVKEKLSEADVYFQSSVIEGIPNTIYEAAYNKLPIVTSNVGGISEVIKNDVSGFLTAACNPEECADKIMKLLESKNLREQLGNMAHNHIIKNFSRDDEIKKWQVLYGTI